MPDQLIYIPTPSKEEDDGFVSLTRTAQGRLLRKKILPMNGSFVHPNHKDIKVFVDKEMAENLKKNFDKGYCEHVQVPVVNDLNQHVEDPLRNAGEVIDIDFDDTGVYATIDARKWSDDFGKTILGASAMMDLNHTDTATGEKVGPTLLHVAATNRAYVNNLGDYQDILLSAADNNSENNILFLSEAIPSETEEIKLSNDKGTTMTVDEAKAFLKENGIDVEDLQAKAAENVELSSKLDSVNEQLALSGEPQVNVDDLAEALVELSSTNKANATRIETLEAANASYVKREAEHEIDALVLSGRVLPAQRNAMVELSLTNREMFDNLVPEKAIVTLSETGVTVHENTHSEDHAAAVAAYAARAAAKK